nr:5'-nucleotidase C-terminal domain-containing protein [uncultured Cetobacterium sp.]
MKSSKFFVLGAILSLALVGCGEKDKAPETATNVEVKEFKEEGLNLEQKVIKKGEAGADEVVLTFAATSDVHGRIYPYEYGIDSEDKDAGYAKTYTIVKSLREKNPNLILMDVGDTVQDNSAELFNNLETHPMVEAMNTMDYDAWILGNHEFNFEKEFLLRNIKNFEGSVISVNIENEKDGSKFVLPYQIFDIQGVKVALVGGIPPHVPMWEASAPEHFKGLTFEDPKTAVEETLNELNGKYDVLVGAFHLGRKDEYGATGVFDLAEMYPQFDLIFAGHEHARYVTDVNGTTVLEPGAYGWGVSTGDIKVVKKDGKWEVAEVVAKNLETKDVEADKGLLEQFKDVHEKSIEDANQVVGKVNQKFIANTDYITGEDSVTTMPTSQLQDNAIVELINNVQKHYAKSDISSAAVFNFDSNLDAGDFKKKDVAFIYKYTNTLMGVNMTGENLLKYMEWSMNYYNQTQPGDITISFNPEVRGYNYDMFEGVDYKVDISKPAGERVVDVTVNGEALDPNKTYKVAVNNYRFGSLLNLGLIKNEDKYYDSYEELQDGGRVRDLIVRYVQEELKGELTPTVDNNWEIIGFDQNVSGKEAVIEKIKSGEIVIPMSEDGRTLNVKSININNL